jgi:hypothetical protein
MRLVSDYYRKGHVLYIDNAFTSPTLLESLNAVGVRCCGSVRRNRKGMPPQASISDEEVRALRRGGVIQRQKGDTTVCVWKDQKVVWLLYNHLAADQMTTVERYDDSGVKLSLPCPAAISDYFHAARSVDVVNQLHYAYPTGRKSMRCWSRLVWWLIDICIVNAFQLWRHGHSQLRQLHFREQLMLQLMEQLPEERRPHRHAAGPSVASAPHLIHYSQHSYLTGDCAHCSHGREQRKRTHYICAACKVHLCIGACFFAHHSNL